MDGDPPRSGLSPEKAEQLRQLLPILEERVKEMQGQAGVDDLVAEVAQIRETIEKGNNTTVFRDVLKSVRNIAEGIVGAAIYDLIPSSVKTSVREGLLGASEDTRTPKTGTSTP